MAGDYDIGKRTGKCSATERSLAEGESYYAVLLETAEGFERRDYTLDSWEGPPEGAFCYWRGRVPTKDRSKGPVVVDTALLMQLFMGLEEEEAQAKQQFRFILSLLLMRKRLLKLSGTVEEDGKEYWRLVLMSDKSEHRVLNPQLSPQEVERLSAQLTAILTGEAAPSEALEWTEVPQPDEDESQDGPESAEGQDDAAVSDATAESEEPETVGGEPSAVLESVDGESSTPEAEQADEKT
jgi:hypothetical protein